MVVYVVKMNSFAPYVPLCVLFLFLFIFLEIEHTVWVWVFEFENGREGCGPISVFGWSLMLFQRNCSLWKKANSVCRCSMINDPKVMVKH